MLFRSTLTVLGIEDISVAGVDESEDEMKSRIALSRDRQLMDVDGREGCTRNGDWSQNKVQLLRVPMADVLETF